MRDLVSEIKGLLPEPVVVNIQKSLKISEDMDDEVDKAASLFGYYAVLAERAETRYEKMRFAYKTWRASTEAREAKSRQSESLKRFTVEEMKSHVNSQAKYKAYQLTLIKLDEHRRTLKVIAKAFELKKDMIQTKCSNRRGER